MQYNGSNRLPKRARSIQLLRFPPAAKLIQRSPQADLRLVLQIMPGAADVEGEVLAHDLHAHTRERRFRATRPQQTGAFVHGCGAGRVLRLVESATIELTASALASGSSRYTAFLFSVFRGY